MPATVETRVNTGAGPTSAAAATVRLKNADNNTIDANNPVVRPLAGVNYSFWKTIHFHCTGAPDTSISNVKLYTDGALGWTGITTYVGDQQTDTYVQATGNSDSGDEMVANHSQISSRTDLFSYTSGSPLDVSLASTWDNTTGRITAYVVLQAEVSNTANGGAQAAETATWRYDEV